VSLNEYLIYKTTIETIYLPRNSVTGWGKVRGRKVFVTADDFSVRGGHADGGIGMKAPYGEVCDSENCVTEIQISVYLDFGAKGKSASGMDHNSVFPFTV